MWLISMCQALLDKSKEKGARAESLATSTEEKEDREGQNERDEVFLADTKDACKKKTDDWDQRCKMRSEEIAAIGEAISILRSDDARDTFKKSFESQDQESFVQTQSTKKRKHHTRRGLALSAIRQAALKSPDLSFPSERNIIQYDTFNLIIGLISIKFCKTTLGPQPA